MKHTKISKLVSVVLVVCMMMLSAVSVAAAGGSVGAGGTGGEGSKLSIDDGIAGESATVTAQQDIATTKIKVEGITKDINMAGVTLVLLAPEVSTKDVEDMIKSGTWDETKVVSMGQVFANADGSYTYEFTLKDTAAYGDYTVIATSNDVARTQVYFASPTERKNALKKILKAPDDETVIDTMDKESDFLGVDAALWTKLGDVATKKDAADAIRANTELKKIDPDNITEKDITDAAKYLDAETLTAALNAKKIENLGDYADKVADKATMTSFAELSEAAEKYATVLVSGKAFASAVDMEKALPEAVKIAFMVKDGLNDLDKYLQYAIDLGLERTADFNLLTPKQKREVVNAVAIKEPTTVVDLNTAFKNAVADFDKEEGGNDSKPSYITAGGTGSGNTNKDLYVDIDNYGWAKDAIYALSKKGVLSGYGNGIFGPANQIKREEFAKVIVSAMYGDAAVQAAGKMPSFADAGSGWYSAYVGYAEQTGLIKGVSEAAFGIGANITRQDIMVILYRVMVANGKAVNTNAIAYADAAQIADYAADAVFALANAGIVGGYEDGSIKPQGQATRAEVAVMVNRFLTVMGK